MEIIKIAPETLEALQNAPCAQPPRPLPMAEAGTAVKDATEVWGKCPEGDAACVRARVRARWSTVHHR